MTDFLQELNSPHIKDFFLLFLRVSGVLSFFPFFENNLVPLSVRGALSLYVSAIFYPSLAFSSFTYTPESFIIACLCELFLGVCASIFLQIVFSSLVFATDSISFSMGLTMASAYDPISGSQKPIVGQALLLLAILILLDLSFHHKIILFVEHSLKAVPLGQFIFEPELAKSIVKAFSHLFVIGFSMAFPILCLVLLSDIIFGMIMKTHPQFNLLAIGFPVKIAVAFVGIILITFAIMGRFKDEISLAFSTISKIF
ncbi:flagellar biosynthetic protein FliR [Helicobacter cetorum]|uniref:Flagellar biosynthetic protein FliR n=1 Tax=Helicobacter cetorum (strain ATCC BAA-540 / CCUG 52418 / MIT 99-5656) TaxID=1163745 RepID=I0ERR0_HELCM|nr:flagellar biosynthetic protein FliR [Helicobacter cetorum]AFI05629.1 flagellar biosynthesis protein FliR [Helicobacter cetorum MIT 99-5656]